MYNIQDGRRFRLTQAIWAVQLCNYDLMLMMETKILYDAYFHKNLGYDAVFSQAVITAAGGDQGGVGLVVRERPYEWSLGSMRFHGPNVVICKIVSGGQNTLLVRAYLPLSTLDQLPDLEEALSQLLGKDYIIIGHLNADIGRLWNLLNQHVADFLDSFGLFDLHSNFRQRMRLFCMKMWWQV